MPPWSPDDSESEVKAPVFIGPQWILFFDNSSRKQGTGAVVLLLTPAGEQFKYMVHHDLKEPNNMTKGDSQLIIKQVKGECSCNDP
jgi:hypothetical protein